MSVLFVATGYYTMICAYMVWLKSSFLVNHSKSLSAKFTQCSSFQLSDLHRAGVGQPASVDTGGGHQHGQWSGHHRYNCLNMVVCFIGSGLQQFKALGTRRHWDL